jgi:hypothetical protein
VAALLSDGGGTPAGMVEAAIAEWRALAGQPEAGGLDFDWTDAFSSFSTWVRWALPAHATADALARSGNPHVYMYRYVGVCYVYLLMFI